MVSLPEDGQRLHARVSGTAGFFLWLETNHCPGIVKKLNSAMRNGEFETEIFVKDTGMHLDDLWAAYVTSRHGEP